MVCDGLPLDSAGDEPAPTAARKEDAPAFPATGDVTRVLSQIEHGDGRAAEQLLPLVYEELRKLAAGKMAQEKPGQTLQATALVHEAYIRLVDVEQAQHWNSRGHFFGAAAGAMRRILVERARQKRSLRQGGQCHRCAADLNGLSKPETTDDVLAIDEALEKLAHENLAVVKVVELRYFAGLTLEEVADASGISLRTANRYWNYAKAWLHDEISDDGPDD